MTRPDKPHAQNSLLKKSRRQFLKTTAATAAASFVPYTFTSADDEPKPKSPNERLRVGSIGMRYQGTVVAKKAALYGDVVAIADVDRLIGEKAIADFGGQGQLYENYEEMLARDDIDVITIGAPDHWHTKMLIDACKAGKDVYCEKPLTLTVDEGKQIAKVVKETGRVVQVGTWQRADHRFRLAVELVNAGHVGKLKRVVVVIGANKQSGSFKPEPPPSHLNWNLWQGQTPDVPYIKERCHYTFRWWYEYSGGQMTDWGAHHIDIAQWGIGAQHSGPVAIETEASFPDVKNGYNVAKQFVTKYRYANGVELVVYDRPTGEYNRKGVMFEGTEGRLFVNRGSVSGKAVDELKVKPFKREDFQLYEHDNLKRPKRMGKLDAIVNHMGNFFDCIQTREDPLSDVYSQHRSVSTCHLGNISMRLGRPLKWNPDNEEFVDDAEANSWLKREQRAGFEITA